VISERKRRDAEDVDDVEVPQSKKPRLDVESGESVAPEFVHPAPPEPSQLNKLKAKGKPEAKDKDGGGSFKENPYTFLSPDDPILQSCMFVFYWCCPLLKV
jgi:multisite-specific tRNA:(cytosine-C5)-methyltransferase